jgi:uncharacterized protein YecT (DUF1311 family)
MTQRNRILEILQIKQRGQRPSTLLHYEFEGLVNQWLESRSAPGSIPDWYLIRAVTLIEVFTRAWVAQIVDHGPPYNENAVALSKNLKIDYDLLHAISGRTITLGDVIAHSVSVNNLDGILYCLESLIQKPLRPLLEAAVDRWAVEVEGEKSIPIIGDFSDTCRLLARMFEVRHILCHELPKTEVFQVAEIEPLLAAATRFTHAAEECLAQELFGTVPLTQTDMNIRALEELEAVDKVMDRLLSDLRERRGDERARELLEDSQKAWLVFRERQCALRADPEEFATINPLLRANEATSLTKERIRQLRWYLEREEGDL